MKIRLAVIALIGGLDQAVKAWATANPAFHVWIPGVLATRLTENTGIAFSLFTDQRWITLLLSALVLGVLVYVLVRTPMQRLPGLCGWCIVGGALSNLLDRCLRGKVVDMFEFLFVRFAVFNVADAVIVLGSMIFLIAMITETRPGEGEHGKGNGY